MVRRTIGLDDGVGHFLEMTAQNRLIHTTVPSHRRGRMSYSALPEITGPMISLKSGSLKNEFLAYDVA